MNLERGCSIFWGYLCQNFSLSRKKMFSLLVNSCQFLKRRRTISKETKTSRFVIQNAFLLGVILLSDFQH
jgi:hypothetical protein